MPNDRMRIDKWLWNVRIFKSRTKATNACKKGAIKIGELRLKPSSLITVNNKIEVRKDGFILEFLIKELIPKRVSATLAEPCYDNITPLEELNKFKNWFMGKAPAERRDKGLGRPTKRERRDIDEFKDEVFLDDWFDD
jgi:ribosome-associated heat shock protein Hsp15